MLRVPLLLCCLVAAPAAFNYMEVAKLRAAGAAAEDDFGRSVAIDGGTVVVGAPQWDNGGSGVVYVFRTTDGGATYGQVAKLTASDASSRDYFGCSVAIDGDTVVVGAYWKSSGRGALYVFLTTGGATYGEVARLTASDATYGDEFGRSVAIDGDTVVVGATQDYSYGTGAVYVFRTTDGGATYVEVAKLTAADGAVGDRFGISVAIDGATVVIGAYWDDNFSGSAYVFRTTDGGATYGQVAKLTADTANAYYFGVSVAIAGDTVVVGAYYENNQRGAAYVFRTTDGGATYGQVAKLTAADAAAYDFFGYVAIDGDSVVIGSPYDDDGGDRSGSAYVFSPPAPTAQPTTAQPTAQPTKHIDVLDPWEIALILIACLIFCVACFVFLRPSATAWTRTKAFGAAAMAWMRTKAHGAAATAARISPAAPPAAETPPILRTTSVLPMGTVEAVQAPDAAAAPPILGEVVTHSTVLSVSN
jgi:hypothetical protein